MRQYLPAAIEKGYVGLELDCKHIGQTTGDIAVSALGVLLVLNFDGKRADLLVGYEPVHDKSDASCATIVYDILEHLGIENFKRRLGVITDAAQGKVPYDLHLLNFSI